MDERIGVDAFDGTGQRQGRRRAAADCFAGGERQGGSDAFAAGKNGVAHRLVDCRRLRGFRR